MSIYKIHHITKYKYDRVVKENANQIKIYPFPKTGQEILSHEIQITGEPSVQKFYDYWGNGTAFFTLVKPHKELIIDSRLIVNSQQKEIDERISVKEDWNSIASSVENDIILYDYARKENIQKQNEIDQIIKELDFDNKSPLQAVKDASAYIFQHYKYVKGITTIETTVDEIIALNSGVCQDFAHLLLQILRTKKIPTRYVSGYICPNKNGMRGEGATHAWVDVYLPKLGWIGIDPTNNCYANLNHIQLAVGRHFNDCSPIKGTFKGPANQELFVYVSVGYEDGRIFEDENKVQLFKEIADVAPLLQIQNQQQ